VPAKKRRKEKEDPDVIFHDIIFDGAGETEPSKHLCKRCQTADVMKYLANIVLCTQAVKKTPSVRNSKENLPVIAHLGPSRDYSGVTFVTTPDHYLDCFRKVSLQCLFCMNFG